MPFHHFHSRFGGFADRRSVRDDGERDASAPRGRHGHGRHREGGEHRGGGRDRDSGRVFDHGDVRLVIMALLRETPRHGYEIIKALEERVGGGYSPSPGVIYPTLTLLEEAGHAEVAEAHGGRKLYTLTAQGLAYLAANQEAADAILARVAAGSVARRGPPPPVARALENLATAVRLRIKGQTVSPEAVRAIATAIDAAARAVEEA